MLKDPILSDFLKAWGRVVLENQEQGYVASEISKLYQRQQKQVFEHKGYVAEVYMAQVLWNMQRKTVPGGFFHQDRDVQFPDRFFYIRHRVRLGAGSGCEIDVYVSAGPDLWIGESKWWTQRKVGVQEVEDFWSKRPVVLEIEGELRSLSMWFFSSRGFSREAQELMQELGMYWSDKQDLNRLLDLAGLRRLPEID